MKNQKWIALPVALVLIAGTAAALVWLRANQKLGKPGIFATPIAGKVEMKIALPENAAGFTSTNVPEPEIVLGYLPADSSYAERIYTAPDGFWVQATIVLMGADRTSIHNADYCLSGQGFTGKEKSVVTIPINDRQPYLLPVSRWNVSGVFTEPGGQRAEVHGVYIFWFVADGSETPGHLDFMMQAAWHLMHTGILQRWAYVSYFAYCAPGQEDATFARMEKVIAVSVPKFQPPQHKQ